jgi:hypothetical protein
MKYICPNEDCTAWGYEGNCPHGVPHEELDTCFWSNLICPNCEEIKDEDS